MEECKYDRLKESREYKAAINLEDALNDMCFDYEMFVESIRFMHPTLQQKLFRLIKETILYMADENKRYIDARNRASHEGARKLEEIVKDLYIPCI